MTCYIIHMTDKGNRTQGWDNDFVGKSPPSKTVKHLYRNKHFSRVAAPNDTNPQRKIWVPNGNVPSLKEFAKKFNDNPVIVQWRKNKA